MKKKDEPEASVVSMLGAEGDKGVDGRRWIVDLETRRAESLMMKKVDCYKYCLLLDSWQDCGFDPKFQFNCASFGSTLLISLYRCRI